MVGRARFLRAARYAVLLIDLQATGESEGSHITFGWRERHDVLAATEFVRRTLPNSRIAIIGSSLGGAAALLAEPQLRVDALVLESVYPTIEDATRNRLRMRLGPFGSLTTPLLLLQLRARLHVSTEQLRPIDHIGAAKCPVLIIAGSLDRHTTATDTTRLFAAAASPKQLWLVPGAAHVDLHRFAPRAYERRVLSFLASALGANRLIQLAGPFR